MAKTANDSRPPRIAVLISGRGSNLQSIIDAIASRQLDASVAVVISNRADAPGLQRAREAGIEALHISSRDHPDRDAYDRAIVEALQARHVTLVCLAGFMRLVGAPLLEAFPQRVLNIHPSLLPSFRGLDAQRQALEHGVRVTGATVHFVTAELDGGPIILQAAVPLLPDDTVETLSARVLTEEHRLYPEAIRIVLDGGWSIDGRRFVQDPGIAAGPSEMTMALVSAAPFVVDDAFKIVDFGDGDGSLADALLTRFSRATVVVLADSESIPQAAHRLARFGERVRLRPFELSTLDWWDVMFGADVVVSSMCLHRLNDAKKQYLYKAAADRLSPRGAFFAADRLEAQQLLHHLVWLKHAGFPAVDCVWLRDGHAVFGGFKQAEASAARPPGDS
jgi:phosphoribosylglycinamide formyltransferase 1